MNSILVAAIAYLILGVFVLAWCWMHPLKSDLGDLQDAMQRLGSQKPGLADNSAKVIGSLLGSVFAIAAWPVVVVQRSRHKSNVHKGKLREEEEDALRQRPLSMHPDAICSVISVLEAEQLGAVEDPMGWVPAKPFGHLNSVWVALRDQRESGDLVISFFLPVGTVPIPSERFSKPIEVPWRGIAVKRNDVVVSEFLFAGC